MGESTPAATLESLMHEFEVEPVSLVGIVGSLDLVREVIQGQRRISKAQADSLAKFFSDLSPKLSLTAKDFGQSSHISLGN